MVSEEKKKKEEEEKLGSRIRRRFSENQKIYVTILLKVGEV